MSLARSAKVSEQRYANRVGGPAQFLVECGEREIQALRKFEVTGIAKRGAVAIREMLAVAGNENLFTTGDPIQQCAQPILCFEGDPALGCSIGRGSLPL